MRRIHVALVVTLFASGAAAIHQAAWLLDSTRIGKVSLGMTVDELYNAAGRENVRLVDLFGEGMFTPAMQVYDSSDPGVPVLTARIISLCGQYRIDGITVYSPQYRTREGVGVGSTVAEVRKRYPQASLNREESPSLIVESKRLTFAVASDTFADSVRVTKIWTTSTLPDSLSRCRRR